MRNFIVLFTILLLFGMKLTAQKTSVLKPYVWKNRILVLFTQSEQLPVYQKQVEEFRKHQSGLDDRDLLIFTVLPQKVITPEGKVLGREATTELRQKYFPDDVGYTVVLVGKDGGKKLKQSTLLEVSKLYGIIDQMPMRKREMREKSG